MKRFFCLFLLLAVVSASLAACKPQPKPGTDTDTTAPNDAQAAAQNETTPDDPGETTPGEAAPQELAGAYVNGRCHIDVTAEETEMRFKISWSGSAKDVAVWEMSGAFDPSTQTVAYENCTRTDHEYGADGADTGTVIFENGKGVFRFADGKLIWQDEQEEWDDMEFTRDENAAP